MAVPAGPCVVLTRAPDDNRDLAEALRARGIEVREIPCVGSRWLEPPPPRVELAALSFGSRRGVRGFTRLPWARDLSVPLVAAVGPATAAELAVHGLVADLVADPPRGEVLARELDQILAPDATLGVVRGNLRGGSLEPELERRGRAYLPVEVYENVAPELPVLDPFPVAAVFVAAPSAGRRLLAHLPWLRAAPFFAIGPTTRAALESLGVHAVIETGTRLEDQVEALASR